MSNFEIFLLVISFIGAAIIWYEVLYKKYTVVKVKWKNSTVYFPIYNGKIILIYLELSTFNYYHYINSKVFINNYIISHSTITKKAARKRIRAYLESQKQNKIKSKEINVGL